MLSGILILVAAISLGSVALSIMELSTITMSGSGTVFQQISARVDLGLSLLVFVTSAGLGGIISRMDSRTPDAPSKEAIAAAERRNARTAEMPPQ